MTPAELAAALNVLGWTPSTLAVQLGMNERQARRWRDGENRVPKQVAAWLADLAAYHRAHPAPPFNVKPPRNNAEKSKNPVDSPILPD